MSEQLSLLTNALALPAARVRADGTVVANASASEWLNQRRAETAPHWVALVWETLCGTAQVPARLVQAIGEREEWCEQFTSMDGSRWRLLVLPQPRKEMYLVLAREAEAQSTMQEAATWCHEISNATGAALGWVQLVRKQPELRERALHHIEASVRSTQAAAERVTRRLHASASRRAPSAAPREEINLSVLLADLVDRMRPQADKAGVRLETDIAENLTVAADAEQIASILLNVVKNALEAFDRRGGVVRVVASKLKTHVEIDVQDNGRGMPKDVRRRILRPYFTTKKSGSGLGLPVVKELLENLGGSVSIKTEEGGGTSVTMTIPRVDAEDVDVTEGHGQTALDLSPRGLRVLVVDDEPAIRELVATSLEIRGAHVTKVSSFHEVRSLNAQFDVALVDYTLQDCSGDEVVAYLRAHAMAHSTIICSGVELPAKLALGGTPDRWLRKPFELDDLLAEVCAAFERVAHRVEMGA